jgi:serine phosphatase RsbU (regulator of sigma subunit)
MTSGAPLSSFAPPIEWGIAARTLPGETESGDLHFVEAYHAGILVAIIDGLGHGPEAAHASRLAAATLHDHIGQPASVLIQRCHAALLKSRGVVISLAIIESDGREMTWLGVGNVDGTLYRASASAVPQRESLPRRGGVVGYQLPPLREATLPLGPGDTLVFATDGIASTYVSESPIGWQPQDAANYILRKYGKSIDDALVMVVRTIGEGP